MRPVDCCRTGHCCGYRWGRDFGGHAYEEDEDIPSNVITEKKGDMYHIPLDENNVCIYLEKHNNGFTSCKIHEKKPRMCKLYNCLTEKKVKYINVIIEELKRKRN